MDGEPKEKHRNDMEQIPSSSRRSWDLGNVLTLLGIFPSPSAPVRVLGGIHEELRAGGNASNPGISGPSPTWAGGNPGNIPAVGQDIPGAGRESREGAGIPAGMTPSASHPQLRDSWRNSLQIHPIPCPGHCWELPWFFQPKPRGFFPRIPKILGMYFWLGP